MSAMTMFFIMTLWWFTTFVTNRQAIHGDGPSSAAVKIALKILVVPSAFGVLLLPVYMAIWGQIEAGSVIGYTAAALIVAMLLSKVVAESWVGLFASPLAALSAISGFCLLAAA